MKKDIGEEELLVWVKVTRKMLKNLGGEEE